MVQYIGMIFLMPSAIITSLIMSQKSANLFTKISLSLLNETLKSCSCQSNYYQTQIVTMFVIITTRIKEINHYCSFNLYLKLGLHFTLFIDNWRPLQFTKLCSSNSNSTWILFKLCLESRAQMSKFIVKVMWSSDQ